MLFEVWTPPWHACFCYLERILVAFGDNSQSFSFVLIIRPSGIPPSQDPPFFN